MPEIEFRESREFKGLDGQSLPKGDLLDRVFRQARFDTRFYEEVDKIEKDSTDAGKLLHSSPLSRQIPVP